MIVDGSGNPVNTETEKEEPPTEESSGNGQTHGPEVQDARTIPTGLLIYNLVLCTNNLQMNGIALEQMKQVMAARKMVGEPPEFTAIRQQTAAASRARDIMVNELNSRFADSDMRHWAHLGLDPYTGPEQPEEPEPTEQEG